MILSASDNLSSDFLVSVDCLNRDAAEVCDSSILSCSSFKYQFLHLLQGECAEETGLR